MQRPEIAASGRSRDSAAFLFLESVWNTVNAALREIFDESAYTRFLQRTNTTRTRQSYRAFLREREAAHQKPRCC